MSVIVNRVNLLKLLRKRNLEKLLYVSYKVNSSHSGNHNFYKNCNNNYYARYLGIGAGITALILYKLYDSHGYHVSLSSSNVEDTGEYRPDLPDYPFEEVVQHCEKSTRIWVTYKRGVYDITDFIPEHPGGDQIMMAAGASLEPFWLLYGIHKTAKVYSLLAEMRIGNVAEEVSHLALHNMDDPYEDEPHRHKILVAHSEKPFNAEPPSSLLIENFITPNEFFYVRNHLPVPEVDLDTYELEIEVEGSSNKKTLNFKDIKKLSKHTIISTIMCAGNRRSEMDKIKEVKGLGWGSSSIGNAEWSGARLVDVLKMMGIDDDTTEFDHVHFEGLDADTTNTPYTASIPLAKAVNKKGDVLLAYEMNGEPIPRDHGFPIRVIVPGTCGARNVKWLSRIYVSKKESDSHWQCNDYKGVSPSADPSKINMTELPSIQELPVISAICKPLHGDAVKIENNHIIVKGYAWSGGGRKIIRVDLTVDGGKEWHVANFDHQENSEAPRHWSWTLWSAKIPVAPGTKAVEIWAKAVDSSYNTQPDTIANIWNFRGFLNNAYHRIKVNLI